MIRRAGHLVSPAAWLFIALCGTLAFGADAAAPSDAKADPYAVPSGNNQVLIAFLQKLLLEHPQTAEDQLKLHQAALKAAEKILSSKPTDQQLLIAAKVKSSVLHDPKELADFEEEMTKAGKKTAVRVIRVRRLGVELDATVADAAAFRKKLEEVKKFFEDKQQLLPGDEQLAKHASEVSERTGDTKLIAETYEDFAKLLPSQMPYSVMAKDLQASARRWRLPGNAMRMESKTLDGKAIDISDYRGKVVLVDFWATWCPPCRAEIPNIKKSYENYHDKGFEVVGISLDTGPREQLADFIKKEEVPWAICRDIDSPTKIAEYYGIHSIPTMILVGRDGKVVSLNARGSALAPLVEKALAESPAATDDKKTAKKSSGKEEADLAKEKSKGKPKAEEEAKKKADEIPKVASALRTWTDSSGKFKIQAKFRGVINQKVKLEREDGSILNLPLEKLSDEDQDFVKKRKSDPT